MDGRGAPRGQDPGMARLFLQPAQAQPHAPPSQCPSPPAPVTPTAPSRSAAMPSSTRTPTPGSSGNSRRKWPGSGTSSPRRASQPPASWVGAAPREKRQTLGGHAGCLSPAQKRPESFPAAETVSWGEPCKVLAGGGRPLPSLGLCLSRHRACRSGRWAEHPWFALCLNGSLLSPAGTCYPQWGAGAASPGLGGADALHGGGHGET